MSATGIVIGLERDCQGPGPWDALRVRPAGGTARAAAVSGARRRGAVRLTRRGRWAVTVALTFLILAAALVLGGASTATRHAGSPEPVSVLEVEEGQTLWGIASEVAAPGEVREMVYRIRELNSLPSSSLVEGQKLAIPAP